MKAVIDTVTYYPESIAVQTPYSAGFVDALKAAIPSDDRRWDAHDRVWLVTADYQREVHTIAEQFFRLVEVVE